VGGPGQSRPLPPPPPLSVSGMTAVGSAVRRVAMVLLFSAVASWRGGGAEAFAFVAPIPAPAPSPSSAAAWRRTTATTTATLRPSRPLGRGHGSLIPGGSVTHASLFRQQQQQQRVLGVLGSHRNTEE
ncbi:unnamed protein product, partial [Scytosiphon promiscuus]